MEAAGIEPYRGTICNWLMGRDFRSAGSGSRRFSQFREFSPVLSRTPESTEVVETFWRRVAVEPPGHRWVPTSSRSDATSRRPFSSFTRGGADRNPRWYLMPENSREAIRAILECLDLPSRAPPIAPAEAEPEPDDMDPDLGPT